MTGTGKITRYDRDTVTWSWVLVRVFGTIVFLILVVAICSWGP